MHWFWDFAASWQYLATKTEQPAWGGGTSEGGAETPSKPEGPPSLTDIYEISDDGTLVCKDKELLEEMVEIPSEIDGKQVKKIGDDAFSSSSVKSVIIPEGVTEIGKNAFLGCKELGSISIP